MGSALWLLLALPEWYFSSVLSPFEAGLLSLVPAAGVISFLVGTALAMRRRQRRMLFFVVPFVLSESFVAVAGALRGQVHGSAASLTLLAFFAFQVVFSCVLIYLIKGARASASALAVFSITYAGFGAFIAGMSFSDTWL